LTEIMPANVRATGFSLAYSLAQAIFGGFTPAISTWLIQSTGNKAMPGAWLAASAVVAVIGAVLLYRRGVFSDDLAIRARGRGRVQSRLHSSHG
jgi:hypothetical protein